MPDAREAILKAALELGEADRLLLAMELMDSVGDGMPGWSIDDPGLADELERRHREETPGIPWEQVKLEARARLKNGSRE